MQRSQHQSALYCSEIEGSERKICTLATMERCFIMEICRLHFVNENIRKIFDDLCKQLLCCAFTSPIPYGVACEKTFQLLFFCACFAARDTT